MRRMHGLLWCGLVSVGVMAGGCAQSSSEAVSAGGAPMAMPEPGSGSSPREYLSDFSPIAGDRAVMTVHGLGCPLCAENINKSLAAVPGVASSKVDMSTGRVSVAFSDGTRPSRAALARSIVDSGFTLVKIEVPGEGG